MKICEKPNEDLKKMWKTCENYEHLKKMWNTCDNLWFPLVSSGENHLETVGFPLKYGSLREGIGGRHADLERESEVTKGGKLMRHQDRLCIGIYIYTRIYIYM